MPDQLQELREINSIISRTDSAYHELAVKFGVSDSELCVLYGLYMEGNGCNQSTLYKNSGLGKTTINSALRKMEKNGLLYLQPGEGRNTKVFLTEKGLTLMQNTAARQAKMEEGILLSWPEEDREKYLELNRRYLNQFIEKIREEQEV